MGSLHTWHSVRVHSIWPRLTLMSTFLYITYASHLQKFKSCACMSSLQAPNDRLIINETIALSEVHHGTQIVRCSLTSFDRVTSQYRAMPTKVAATSHQNGSYDDCKFHLCVSVYYNDETAVNEGVEIHTAWSRTHSDSQECQVELWYSIQCCSLLA